MNDKSILVIGNGESILETKDFKKKLIASTQSYGLIII